MTCTGKQRHFLRGLAHARKPVVTVGAAGLSSTVLDEVERALFDHELIKIKLPAGERTARHALVLELCIRSHAEPIQEVGRIALIYRPADPPRLRLPD